MRLSERTKETRGRMARSPRVRRSVGSLGRQNPRPGSCAVQRRDRESVRLRTSAVRDAEGAASRGSKRGAVAVGGHPASFLETNGRSPVRSPDASQVSQRRPALLTNCCHVEVPLAEVEVLSIAADAGKHVSLRAIAEIVVPNCNVEQRSIIHISLWLSTYDEERALVDRIDPVKLCRLRKLGK